MEAYNHVIDIWKNSFDPSQVDPVDKLPEDLVGVGLGVENCGLEKLNHHREVPEGTERRTNVCWCDKCVVMILFRY